MHGGINVSMTLICKYLSWKEMVSMDWGFSSCSAGRIQGERTTAAVVCFVYTYVFAFLINYCNCLTSVFLLLGLYVEVSNKK